MSNILVITFLYLIQYMPPLNNNLIFSNISSCFSFHCRYLEVYLSESVSNYCRIKSPIISVFWSLCLEPNCFGFCSRQFQDAVSNIITYKLCLCVEKYTCCLSNLGSLFFISSISVAAGLLFLCVTIERDKSQWCKTPTFLAHFLTYPGPLPWLHERWIALSTG